MKRDGATIIEMLVIVLIIGILVTTSSFIIRKQGSRFRMSTTAAQIKQQIAFIKNRTIEEGRAYKLLFRYSTNGGGWCVTMRQDSSSWTRVESLEVHPTLRIMSPQSGSTPIYTVPVGLTIAPSFGTSFPNNEIVIQRRAQNVTPGVVGVTYDGVSFNIIEVSQVGNITVKRMSYVNGSWK